jgi:hypothetical protein
MLLALPIGQAADDELRAPKFKALNALKDLPDHWDFVPARFSIDTEDGSFVSKESELEIRFHNGIHAGERASAKHYPDFKWLTKGRIKSRNRRTDRVTEKEFVCLLSKENLLVMTFPGDGPDEGPANFFVEVKTNEDIEYAAELVLRHRNVLLTQMRKRLYAEALERNR